MTREEITQRTLDKVEFIKNNKANSSKEYAKLLNVHPTTISYLKKKFNLDIRNGSLDNKGPERHPETNNRIAYIKENINTQLYKEMAEHLGITKEQVSLLVNYYKIERNIFPHHIPITIMNRELDIIKQCGSISETQRELTPEHRWKHGICQTHLLQLKEGYVTKLYGHLCIATEFYNKEHNFKYTSPAKGICQPLIDAKEEAKELEKSKRYVAIVNPDYEIIEIFKDGNQALEKRDNLPNQAIKSHVIKNKKFLTRIANGEVTRTIPKINRYIYMKDLEPILGALEALSDPIFN